MTNRKQRREIHLQALEDQNAAAPLVRPESAGWGVYENEEGGLEIIDGKGRRKPRRNKMATNTVRLGATYKHDDGTVMIAEAGSSITADNFVELVEPHTYL